MAKLIYSGIMSLDGYTEDAGGGFGWAAPDEEVHGFVNDLERLIGTYLYGRRMYETMVFWETAHTLPDEPPVVRDFAEIWQAAEKIVYSTTLTAAASARTRIERDVDPAAIRRLKAESAADIGVGGPGVAAPMIAAGLVDEYRMFLHPVVVGAGKPFLPPGVPLRLELLEERRFRSGVVYLRYASRDQASGAT
jgi:dihydrofolate reductase